jgi:hypothetical protein
MTVRPPVPWLVCAAQIAAGTALIVTGALGLSGETARMRLSRVAQASLSPATRPDPETVDATLAERAWNHTALASHRDMLAASAWLAAQRASRLRRTGPLDVVRAADNAASARLNALMADGPSNPLGWYLTAEHLAATAGFSNEVIGALRLSYVTGRFDVRSAERRIGLVLRYWPLLKDDFGHEVKSDVRTLVFGQDYDLTNSRLAFIAYYEAPAQSARLRQTLTEVRADYLYWFDWETEQLKKATAAKSR